MLSDYNKAESFRCGTFLICPETGNVDPSTTRKMKTLLVAALLVLLAEIALGAQAPGIQPPGAPGTSSSEEEGHCLDESGEERDFGATWKEFGGRRSCKCVAYDYGLFSVPPAMDKSPKRWCDLEGCMRGDDFVAPGETKNGCKCIPGTHPLMQDATTKFHCEM